MSDIPIVCTLLALWFCPERVISAELLAPLPPVQVQFPRLCAEDARTGERVVIPWVSEKNYAANKAFLLAHGYTEEQVECR